MVFFFCFFFCPYFFDVIHILFFIQIAYFTFCIFYTKLRKMMVREFPMVVFGTMYDNYLHCLLSCIFYFV